MINNDILRRLRYALNLKDDKMIAIFKLGGLETNRTKVCDWLRKDDDAEFELLKDVELAMFLNGLIIEKRGVKDDGIVREPETSVSNNIVLRKLKIALNLKDNDILNIMANVKFKIGKHELSALFRKEGHKHYRECKDQFLRNFLKGLQLEIFP